ncbi:hypothetical protein [Ewingella americana]|uniref:Uncharacterized protein n=1 Tax=Ewingella americana TaxID=41202 RepID=A0A502GE88_9GAMM|nr:hypothetical protein [Ewingella americana]TPG60051.1 hypothetical protein EAH77_15910 [Ewingella americana]
MFGVLGWGLLNSFGVFRMEDDLDVLKTRLDHLKKTLQWLSLIFILLLIAIVANIVRMVLGSDYAYWIMIIIFTVEGIVLGRISRLTKNFSELRLQFEKVARQKFKDPVKK